MSGMLGGLGSLLGGGSEGGGGAAAVVELLMKQQGGLSGLVNNFQQGGLGDIVGSWVGTGKNLPISLQQVGQMFSGDQLAQLAAHFGGDTAQAQSALAEHLPNIVDKLTPQGSLPQGDDWLSTAGNLLGGLLK